MRNFFLRSPLRLFLTLALMVFYSMGAVAQTTPATPARTPTSPPAASIVLPGERGASADALLQGSARMLALLDAGDYLTLWASTPPSVQPRFVTAESFKTTISAVRAPLGAVSRRSWSGVSRLQYLEPKTPADPPAGLYANVEISGVAADGRDVLELVSMRIADDGSLQFMGYVPRLLTPSQIPAQKDNSK